MASGVDLWFCESCLRLGIPYIACVPFEGQEDSMEQSDAYHRESLLRAAQSVMQVKNSWMVEHADQGLVVWDGNKGGTHNVVQQLVEKKKSFAWINPVAETIWECPVPKLT